MAINSEELNFLVYRYLQESGFTHSAFVFAYESFIHKSSINGSEVPAGALVSFVQRGLQYLELEANIKEETPVLEGEFAGFTAKDLLTRNLEELRQIVQERREKRDEALRPSATQADTPRDIPAEDVQILRGHEADVFICSWNPEASLLATGSGDSTARIWEVNMPPETTTPTAHVLLHDDSVAGPSKQKDVTSLDWVADGSVLATGSYGGTARSWTKDGKPVKSFVGHRGPIFSVKWNKKGDLLLSGGVDKTAIVWDAKTGELRQQFSFHEAPCLDVDWRNNTSFATCSTDKLIYLCKLGDPEPLRRFEGHTHEVNTVKWDPSGRLLASCSDDHTAKIWTANREKCVHDLRDHRKEIYSLKWSPTGLPGTANSPARPVLATASMDHTVRLWDGDSGACLFCLDEHSLPVYSVAFTPDGRYVASGSFDSVLHVWRVRDGTRVRTYKGTGGIFDVSWSKDGVYLAASFVDKTVAVLEPRLGPA